MPLFATNSYIIFMPTIANIFTYIDFCPTFSNIITFTRKNMYSDGVKSKQNSREVLSPLFKILFDLYVFYLIFENSFKTAETADFNDILNFLPTFANISIYVLTLAFLSNNYQVILLY